MNRSFFLRFVFLLLILLICLTAMVFMALQRESGQQITYESMLVLIPSLIFPTKTYLE